MRAPRTIAGLTATALLGALLAGCDDGSQDTGPDPRAAGQALAGALSSGDFAGVVFRGDTAGEVGADFADIVHDLAPAEPSVHAGTVRTDGATATVALNWSWPLRGSDWSYATRARMTRVDGRWQVAWDPSIVAPDLRPRERLTATTVEPRRGRILGAHGRVLVEARPVVRFGIDKSKVGPARAVASARQLARIVGVDPASYARRVQAAGDQQFVEAIVYRVGQIPSSVDGYADLPGFLAVADRLPLAPTREFAAPLLGSVGQVTAEMVQKDPEAYHPGDVAGLSGLEARYDQQLRGTPGVVVRAARPDRTGRVLHRQPAQAGEPLRLTLDEGLETLAEHLLARVRPASALVAIRPSTGEILAAANGPGNHGYNYATYGQVAPGSTFKSVSGLALLRAGLTPSTRVPCTPSITVDGKRFENYDGYPADALGRVPLRTALANSCNTAFISQRGRLHGHDLADAAAALGMGVDHDLGFPAYFGHVAPAASDTEAAADMIGQGTVLASPMAMATVLASIQSGTLVVPRLVTSVDVAPPDGVEPVSRSEAATLRGLLRGVVTSGSGRALLGLPGPPVIAKTGTAEFESDGKTLTHAWMIGAQGDLAVAVFVDRGSSGSGTAGPILEAFLRAARS
ncbi:penicillin-binding transpeptidase domain-containing protein [Nocardioides panaciterrulae]|uniref:Cell division protein FtsI/penicillin-binding protein 2 n=1 Tax=Nocardioides panaciterrulae TaxID=661492 RepID=A0A7Y9JA92_9ACTN|nr:penicillin-binding transpeptidase domain-containing protein [Nocardioides panaciterrulae]NYD40104.1 cell division protein FtsI/penicillin-binding protein 2 [Nocardioides panaciterrulae]